RLAAAALALVLASAVAIAVAAAPARAAETNSSLIAGEVQRTLQGGSKRVAEFWWLPPEYWIMVAKELELPADDQAKVAKFFRDYVIVGAIDAGVDEKKQPAMATIADITRRCHFTRGGQTLEVLHEVNPEVSKLVPTLVYLLRVSLGGLGEGLRLLPLANVDPKGNPILSATTPGELALEFRFTDDGPVHDIRWHAPLTSLMVPRKCPKGGEPLEASWSYCPWHGVKLEPAKVAE
ncbi:MAG TPA: hypothetical protein VEI82_14885, partial [Myxococcota bacterium]|nr:hypothetical protein [Myxococcota bacterium]